MCNGSFFHAFFFFDAPMLWSSKLSRRDWHDGHSIGAADAIFAHHTLLVKFARWHCLSHGREHSYERDYGWVWLKHQCSCSFCLLEKPYLSHHIHIQASISSSFFSIIITNTTFFFFFIILLLPKIYLPLLHTRKYLDAHANTVPGTTFAFVKLFERDITIR